MKSIMLMHINNKTAFTAQVHAWYTDSPTVVEELLKTISSRVSLFRSLWTLPVLPASPMTLPLTDQAPAACSYPAPHTRPTSPPQGF